MRHSDDRHLNERLHYVEQIDHWNRVVDAAELTVRLFDLRPLLVDPVHPVPTCAEYVDRYGHALKRHGDKRMNSAAYAESIALKNSQGYTKHAAANVHYVTAGRE